MRKQYTDHFRMEMVQEMALGVSKKRLSVDHNVPLSTLKHWSLSERKPEHRHLAHREATVAEVRLAYHLMDNFGLSAVEVGRRLRRHRNTIALWRNDPTWDEARLVYDPSKRYDVNDLEDRAVVAQHLCTQTDCVSDRLELMLAAIDGPTEKEA